MPSTVWELFRGDMLPLWTGLGVVNHPKTF
jgi:hypothetical protein